MKGNKKAPFSQEFTLFLEGGLGWKGGNREEKGKESRTLTSVINKCISPLSRKQMAYVSCNSKEAGSQKGRGNPARNSAVP